MFAYRNMLIKETKLKICDFGITKIMKSNYLYDIDNVEYDGTPSYNSPEKFNLKSYGLKSDVW